MIVAKASVSGAQQGNFLSVIQCRVAGMSGSSQLFGDLVLGELTPIGNSASRMVMALQVAGTFGPSGGVARFECASQNTGHGFSWLKITAMRLGSLTQRDLDAGTSTTSGSGTPRVIHATQNGTNAISLPKTSFKTIAQTSLGAGKWIVRANAWIQAQGGAMPIRVECKLVGSNTSLSSFSMSPAFLDGPLWMQIAHSSGSATDVRLRCKRVGSGWSFRFVLVHITAMRVGTLTNFSI
jgi:hypothetical protein